MENACENEQSLIERVGVSLVPPWIRQCEFQDTFGIVCTQQVGGSQVSSID